MKPYGAGKRDVANRHRRGTSRPCPCCMPFAQHAKTKNLKKRARQTSSRATKEDS